MNAPPGIQFFFGSGGSMVASSPEKEWKIAHSDASRRFGTILELRARKGKPYIPTKVKGSAPIRSQELLFVQRSFTQQQNVQFYSGTACWKRRPSIQAQAKVRC